ncbi:MAG: hypothetical protein AAFX99_13000 [Myxococcota bacterium]
MGKTSDPSSSSTSSGDRAAHKDDVMVVRVVILSLASLAALLVINAAIFGAARFVPSRVRAQFFEEAVSELKVARPPPKELRSVEGVWAHEGYLLFEQEWAAYRISTSRTGWPSPDVSVLRSGQGRWYVSEHAFGSVVLKVPPNAKQPTDMNDYLKRYPRHRWQEIEPPTATP